MGAAALVISSPVAALPVSNELESLIEQHKVLWERDEAAWNRVGDLDCHADLRDKVSRVTLCDGRSGPVFGYTDREIDAFIDRSLETQLLFVNKEVHRQTIKQKADAARNRLKSELARQEAEKRRVERSIGRDDACRMAEKCSAETKAIEDKILNYQPKSLRDAALIASFVVDAIKSCEGYLELDQAVTALQTIASVVADTHHEVAA
ncbi:hypothetical protein R5W60_04635 [Brucella pseudintermedia]|uniref:hypothetical protein n=1 Tax=Brucella pseudintermedia TaxID=370111 RepID=UPI00366E4F84|nr:hypothetical protein R5W60_04635 [Brucella pseudintermedia]